MRKLHLKLLAVLFAAIVFSLTGCKKDDNNGNGDTPATSDTEYTQSQLKDGDGNVVQEIMTVKDYGKGTGTITWSKTSTYVLDGLVFVNSGQILTIEAGTVIKGKSGQGENASALIVARGGKLMAEGTAAAPIIFCAEADATHYDLVEGKVVLGDNIAPTVHGLWGGVILLGNGTTNNATTEKSIEGIPTTEERGKYGGNNDNESSGTLKYISIRNGGTDIGEGNEINGLTMGALGNQTVIDYIEVIGNKDDGYEWFGSSHTSKHLMSIFNGDDCFDYDESYRGNGQFWLAVQEPGAGDRIGEHDGGPSDNETGRPYAIPHIYNVTYIGQGADAGKRTVTFRDDAGGFYRNSIFLNQAKGIDIEWLDGTNDSFGQFKNGNLGVTNNIFWEVADGTDAGIFTIGHEDGVTVPQADVDAWANAFASSSNEVMDPGVDWDLSSFDPVPTNNVSGNMASYPSGFDNVSYKGAFAPGAAPWYDGWSKFSQYLSK